MTTAVPNTDRYSCHIYLINRSFGSLIKTIKVSALSMIITLLMIVRYNRSEILTVLREMILMFHCCNMRAAIRVNVFRTSRKISIRIYGNCLASSI